MDPQYRQRYAVSAMIIAAPRRARSGVRSRQKIERMSESLSCLSETCAYCSQAFAAIAAHTVMAARSI